MKKRKKAFWKILAVASSWSALFVTGLVIGSADTSKGLQVFILIAMFIALIAIGNCYTVIDDMTDEEFDEYFRTLMKKRYFEDRWSAARKTVKARKNLKKWEKRYKSKNG